MVRQEMLADFIREKMKEQNLSSYDVARRSKGRITAGTVLKILNQDVRSSSIETIQALAVGLNVPEEDLLRIARGLPIDKDDTIYQRLAEHFNAHDLDVTVWQFLLANLNDMITAFRHGRATHDKQIREMPEAPAPVVATITPGKRKAG